MHGVYLAVEVFSDDLFLLLSGGLSERGEESLGRVVGSNVWLGRWYLGLQWRARGVAGA
jgi:hypothetical protein